MDTTEKLKFIEAATVLWVESALHLLFEIDAVARRHEEHQTGQAQMFAELRDDLAVQVSKFVEVGDWNGLAQAWTDVLARRGAVVNSLHTEDSEMPLTLWSADPQELARARDGRGKYFTAAVADAAPHVERPEDEDAPF